MDEKQCKISIKVVNEIAAYLGSKPFVEVQGLIAALQQAQPIEEKDTE